MDKKVQTYTDIGTKVQLVFIDKNHECFQQTSRVVFHFNNIGTLVNSGFVWNLHYAGVKFPNDFWIYHFPKDWLEIVDDITKIEKNISKDILLQNSINLLRRIREEKTIGYELDFEVLNFLEEVDNLYKEGAKSE